MHRTKTPKILPPKLPLLILILLFKLSLDITYTYVVAPHFSWTEPRYTLDPNILKMLESYILTIGLTLSLPTRVRMPSDFLISLLFLLPVLPTLSIYGLSNESRAYTYMIAVAFIVILLLQRFLPRIKISILKRGPILSIILSISCVLATLMFFKATGVFRYFDLTYLTGASPEHLYHLRTTIKEVAFQDIGALGYLPFWTYYVFMSLLFLLSLYKKKYGILLLLVTLQFIFMGLSARKGVLLPIPLLLGTFIIIQRNSALTLMTAGFLFLVTVSTLFFLAGLTSLPSSLVSERSFFTPARLNYAYYNFFSEAKFVYLSSTSVPVPIDYPYELRPPRLIGRRVLLSDTVSSEGFLGTSYMHFGFPGMIFFAIIIGLLLKLTDSLVIGRVPIQIGTPFATMAFIGLFNSSDLTTSLMTYGILPMMLLLLLLGNRKLWRVENYDPKKLGNY